MMIPRVKSEFRGENTVIIPLAITLSAGEYTEKACKALGYFLPHCTVSPAEDAIITAVKTDGKPEAYRLRIKNGKVFIEYSDYRSLRNALATLSLSVSVKDGQLHLTDTEISDEPACAHRGVMLDFSRGVRPFDRVMEDILFCGKARMNILHLHLADGDGTSVELDSLPQTAHKPGYYTKNEVRQMVELADLLALEIIPEFDMPAHSYTMIEAFPQFACKTGLSKEDQCTWTICTGNEDLYPLYEAVIRELCRMFPGGRYFHMGGDELEFRDLKKRPRYCEWDHCETCKAFRQKHNLAGREEQYYFFVNRINAMVKAEGRNLIFWSDQMDLKKPVFIDKDVICQFWRIAGRGRGPHEGCTMNGQLALGHRMINSYYPYTYADEDTYISEEKIADWRWDTVPYCEDRYKPQIMGSELSIWEYGNHGRYPHYEYTIPSSILLMADKLWNGDKLEYTEEYAQAFTRTVLGETTPEGFNVFAAIGGVLPPRNNIPSYAEKVTLSKEEIEAIITELERSGRYLSADARRAKAYIGCAKYTLETK